MSEIVSPVAQALQSIHHGAIKTIASVNEAEEGNVHVQQPNASAFLPGDPWELTPSDFEGAFRRPRKIRSRHD